jgi:hypothetical protein
MPTTHDDNRVGFEVLTAVATKDYIMTHVAPAGQRLDKHCLKAGIIVKAKVNLPGNDTYFSGNKY